MPAVCPSIFTEQNPDLSGFVEIEVRNGFPGECVRDTFHTVNEDGEAVIENEAEAQAVANLDIDLIGCKSCVKITATNGTIGALALGDATNCPVKESI